MVMMLLRTDTIKKTATTMKLIKLPQQINDRVDINDEPLKLCSGSFLNV